MISRLPQSPDLDVRFDARVTRIERSGPQGRAARVVYLDGAGLEHAVEGAAVVLAAGSLGSTRILLASRSSDFPDGLGNTHGVLGRWLHDHPYAQLTVNLRKQVSVHPAVYVTRAPYDAEAPLRGVGTVLWSGATVRVRSWMQLTPDKSTSIGFNFFGTHPSDERQRVELDGPSAGNGLPALAVRMQFDDATTPALERARDRVLGLFEDAGYAPTVDDWIVHVPGTSVHSGGTVRMHASSKLGMLDGWSRLHAVPNVLVVDSSAFTTGPEKNPTLTAMAIAARACARLARDLRGAG
jgi:choline dehydrogenase-like flavoprotein